MPTVRLFNICRSSNNTLLYDVFTQFYSILYAVPTTVLFVIVIYSIKQQANNYSPVYVKLVSLSYSLNLICWWLDFFQLQTMGFWPFCPFFMSFSEQVWLIIPYFIMSCFPHACLLCCTTISIYQMCVIVSPLKAELWFVAHIKKIFLLIVVIPMICCSHVFISQIRMMYFIAIARMYAQLLHTVPGLDIVTAAFVNGIVGTICFVIIFTTSLIAILRYCQIGSKNSGSVKLRLFLINLYICLSMVIYITLQLFMFHARIIAGDYMYVNRVFAFKSMVSDICYLPIPWVTLFINRRFRSYFRSLFWRKASPFFSTAQSTSGNNKF